MRMSATASALSLAALATIAVQDAAFAQSNTVSFVGLGGTFGNDCLSPTPAHLCLTLSEAIDKTKAGGEIVILSPGLPLDSNQSVNKSLHITTEGGSNARLADGHLNGWGLMIHAGAGDIVSLRGLTFDGVGTSPTGLVIQQASAVHVQNCVIRNFEAQNGWGIVHQPVSASQLFVSDTLVYNNGSTAGTGGILIQPTGSGSARVTLDRVHLENNVVGLWVDGRLITGNGSRVVIRDSAVSGNASDGIIAVSAAGMAPALVVAERTLASYNGGTGLHADGPRAVILLDGNVITQNGTGIGATNGGQLISYGNNKNNNNLGPEGAPTSLFSQM